MTKPIEAIAQRLELSNEEFIPFGRDRGKIALSALQGPRKGRLVLVTAMSPSPAGEGKTTTSIGLTDALNVIGKNAIVALREPSMGPVFGMKGGGAGGGKSQVFPPETINLHFNGDFHAITAAHNLLSAAIDNHLHFGNKLKLDTRRILWPRVLDCNDRALRNIVIGLGGRNGGVPREDHFAITAASEIMAIIALARNYEDLQARIDNIVVGFDVDGEPVRAGAFQISGSMVAILRDALLPNLAQTLEGNPAIIHAGPFANIAHGTSSVLGTEVALQRGDYVIQESGFGSDLGAEKFLDIFCQVADVRPSCIVVVVTLRGIRFHAGLAKQEIQKPNLEAVKKGIVNPIAHLKNMASYGIPVVAAINQMDSDTEEEIQFVKDALKEHGFDAITNKVYAEGGVGGVELAEKVVELAATPETEKFIPIYQKSEKIKAKIEKIVTKIYGGEGVDYSATAEKAIKLYESIGASDSYICMAKTQYSFSDDASLVGRPEGFRVTIREVNLSAGAGFIIPISGSIMTMPGLARTPNYERIHMRDDGSIQLF